MAVSKDERLGMAVSKDERLGRAVSAVWQLRCAIQGQAVMVEWDVNWRRPVSSALRMCRPPDRAWRAMYRRGHCSVSTSDG
eukprot:353206-Chlamydomonas_euryale.AAC.7